MRTAMWKLFMALIKAAHENDLTKIETVAGHLAKSAYFSDVEACCLPLAQTLHAKAAASWTRLRGTRDTASLGFWSKTAGTFATVINVLTEVNTVGQLDPELDLSLQLRPAQLQALAS